MINVIISFDDGRSDQYEAFKVLRKNNLKASFHVTTGFIDQSFETDSFGVDRKPLLLSQLKEMYTCGMDISSHGDMHLMNNSDFCKSYEKLKKWGFNDGKIGFSVPNSDYSDNQLLEFASENEDKLSYIRVGRSPKCYSFISKVAYLLFHISKLQVFYNYFNKYNLLDSFDKNRIYSCVVLKDIKSRNIIQFIEKNKKSSSFYVLMFHSIVDKPRNKWEYSIEEFEKICNYLREAKIKVLTLKDLSSMGVNNK